MRARLKVSRAGVELIKSFEGLRQTAARLPDGRWTLGYGHTFSARDGATVTQEDADALLRFDLLPIVDSINNLALVPLNQNQFDALVSFCFNIGVDNFATSGVLKRINEGRMTEAALAMDSWRSAEFNGQTYVLAPLIRRRAAEKNLFLTPEEITGNAPSLLVRPVEDAAGEPTRPTEVDAPDRNGILSARPMSDAPVTAVVETTPTAFTPPFEISSTPKPYVAPPVERQVIDLAAFAPRAPEPEPVAVPVKPTIVRMADVSPMVAPQPTPAETVVEQLPFGLASTGALRETPQAPVPGVVEQSPTAYDYDPVPVMSPEVQAALARAQEEQRLQDQRQAEALAAARLADEQRLRDEARLREEARLQELQRQEFARLEAARAEQARAEAFRAEQERLVREEQMRAELARLEQARLEQTYLEQARLEVERQERERLEAAAAEAARLEAARAEAARVEAARVEAARVEAARVEAERAEALRLEQQRADQMRIEAARLEMARMEAARAESARLEAERAEALRVEQERAEQARLEAQKQAQAQAEAEAVQAQSAPAVLDEEAEKVRKAEAAAALMRLYSPYGAGTLGRPLTPPVLQPAPESAPRPEVKSDPQPEPVRAEPAKQSAPQTDSDPQGLGIQSEDEIRSVSSFVLKPPPSASSMPPPQITALNPYARPVPQSGPQPVVTSEAIVEVPRPAPVDLTQTAAPAAKADAPLHWREQLQRPLPQDFTPQPAQPEQASFLRTAQATGFEATVDDAEDWTNDGGRIALSSEEMEEEAVSWWKMIVSTLWWILISCLGLICLGVATAAYVRAVNDPTVLRNGQQGDFTTLSIITAAGGIFLVCVSVWLIMKRLGGLKD